MSWVIVATVGMGALSMADGQKKREAMKAANLAEAEKSRYAYLTGGPMGQITPDGSSEFGDFAKGAASGFSTMQGFQNSQANMAKTQADAELAKQQLEEMKKNQMLQNYNPNLMIG